MTNVQMDVKGSTLTVTVDLDAHNGRSATGKTEIVASTKGNQQIPGRPEIIGLNIYRK